MGLFGAQLGTAWGSRSHRRSIQARSRVNHEGQQFDAFLAYNYGRFLARRSRLVESKLHLDRAVELVPDYRDTWYDRAKLKLTHGQLCTGAAGCGARCQPH
jgi:hypothetical protein